ncbi:TetR/AcrR family transcriptional regulator [Nannocystaceae bacterium ST9]
MPSLPARLLARARLDVDERRARLLALGLELFGRRGFESISIDDIAQRAGISRGLLYHYFRNKRGFYVETIRFAAAQLRERLAPDPALPPRERLERGLAAYLDYVSDYADAYSTLLRGGGAGDDDEVRTIVEATRVGIIADMIEGMGVESDAALVRVALRGWLGMVEFSAIEWLARREQVSREELVRVLLAACEAALEVVLGADAAVFRRE